jgi:hypothetical protein
MDAKLLRLRREMYTAGIAYHQAVLACLELLRAPASEEQQRAAESFTAASAAYKATMEALLSHLPNSTPPPHLQSERERVTRHIVLLEVETKQTLSLLERVGWRYEKTW